MGENPAGLVYGRIYVGLLFNILLFGILITQYYIYHTTYKKDPIWIKTFVWVLMILDIFNSVVNSYFIYDGVITHFGDFDYLLISNWCINAGMVYLPAGIVFNISPIRPRRYCGNCELNWTILHLIHRLISISSILKAVIAIMVQFFFAWRIQVLVRKWYLTSVIVAISLAGLAMALVTNWIVIKTPRYSDFPQWKGVVVSWLACTAFSDIVIAVSLVWFLVCFIHFATTLHRNSDFDYIDQRTHKTGFRKSDVIVDRIIRITVQTGLLTSIIAILDIVTYLSEPDGTHLMLNTPLCKIYANSILSSLNARGGWRFNMHSLGEGTSQLAETTSHFQSFRIENDPNNLASNVMPGVAPRSYVTTDPVKSAPEVHIHVESHEMSDGILKRPSLTM
ncbi:hypothetical protein Ac2012v2_007138 [Leucoagaricus gongylophorus]